MKARQILRHRDPGADRYDTIDVFAPPESFELAQAPGIALEAAAFFPPETAAPDKI